MVQRLAVLLAAGVPPAAAWGYLRHDDFTDAIARSSDKNAVPEAIVGALDLVAASESAMWRGVAVAWAVATDAGAPLAPTLQQFAASLRDLAEARRQVGVALAAPVATARLVMVLPAVGVLFGIALGFDTPRTLFTTFPGWTCLAVGAVLMYAGWRWNRRLVRAAQPGDTTPGLEFDLVAIAVSGGGSLGAARSSVAASVARFSPGAEMDLSAVDDVLDLSTRAGVPAADLLRSEAIERRRAARASAQESAQRLSVRLMIPLGVCVLPAFMVLGVIPLLISVLSSTAVQL
ncbi:MAG TPA: type II secretion system F family protein [Galbitalea sp.]